MSTAPNQASLPKPGQMPRVPGAWRQRWEFPDVQPNSFDVLLIGSAITFVSEGLVSPVSEGIGSSAAAAACPHCRGTARRCLMQLHRPVSPSSYNAGLCKGLQAVRGRLAYFTPCGERLALRAAALRRPRPPSRQSRM